VREAGLRQHHHPARGDETVGGAWRAVPHPDGHPAEPAEGGRQYGSFVLSRDETALRYRYDEAEMMVQPRGPPRHRARRAITDGPRQRATEQQ
jgi:hypothetical protein